MASNMMFTMPFIELMLQILINSVKEAQEMDENALPESELIFVQEIRGEDIEYTEVGIYLRNFRECILG